MSGPQPLVLTIEPGHGRSGEIIARRSAVLSADGARAAAIAGSSQSIAAVKQGGPRHSVERGHGSLKRDMARAAS